MAENFENRLRVTRATKAENGNITVTGAFSASLRFPRDGKPFSIVERNTQSGKTMKLVGASAVISPNSKMTDKGYPQYPIYIDGKNTTLAELLQTEGVELFNDKLYASANMNRNTEGLFQLMGSKDLDFKAHILVCGDLVIYTGKDGKKHTTFQNITFFGFDHVNDDKVEGGFANCQLEDSGVQPAAPKATAPQATAQYTASDFEAVDDDGDLPF